MARNFRVYGKKRGRRRTGSDLLGTVVMLLFLAAALLGGLGFLSVVLATVVVPEWRVNQRFEEHYCTIEKKRIAERPNTGGVEQLMRLAGWEDDTPVAGRTVRGAQSYRPEFLIRYEVDGQTYTTWTYDATNVYSTDRDGEQVVLDSFTVGAQYACWYDPDDPADAVLVRGYTWSAWLMLLLPVSFVVAGGGGLAYTLVYWGKSAERRAALSQRAQALDPFDFKRAPASPFPFVPNQSGLTDSPGTMLAYRLPIHSAPFWAMGVALTTACLALVLGMWFVFSAAVSFWDGDPQWLMSIFALAFLGAALAAVIYVARRMIAAGTIGASILEVSAHPLYPGGRYDLFLSQAGRLRDAVLEVVLVCEERATYRQGTNTRMETCRVCDEVVLRREGIEIRHGAPLEAKCELPIPTNAMHSFQTDRNEILWRITVRGIVEGRVVFERTSPLVVHPPREGGASQ